jgi:hypothetical protein
MAYPRHRVLPLLILNVAILVSGCGGGGQDSIPTQSQSVSPSNPRTLLAWNPPSNYGDNTALDPYRDLAHYEVYVRENGNFADTDLPVAIVAAVKDASASGGGAGGKTLESEFLLDNIEPFIGSGNHHFVSLKAVGVDGQKSGFMSPVVWDRI